MERPHMPGELLAAIKTRPHSEIEKFFQQQIEYTCCRLPSCVTDIDRHNLQAESNALASLQQFFVSEMQR